MEKNCHCRKGDFEHADCVETMQVRVEPDMLRLGMTA
jgi:hypothetical protein